MKKIYYTRLVSAFAFTAALFTACSEDRDSNPVLSEPSEFTLNTPPLADANTYDLGQSKVVDLTCSQPNYGGFPLSTTYTVQVSLSEQFAEATGDVAANYQTLPTTYTNTVMSVSAEEMNDAVLALWGSIPENEGKEFPESIPLPVYLRLKAMITGSDNRGVCFSNVVTLPKVVATAAAALKVPTELFLVGSMNGNTYKPTGKISGMAGEFWQMVYFKADDTFKLSAKSGEAMNTDATLQDNAASGATVEDDGTGSKQVKIATAGWYVVYAKVAVKSNEYVINIQINAPGVYIFGASNGGVWDYNDSWKFTVPGDATGSFTSPALTAAGEVRMCVKIDGFDWWRLEFTLYNGAIFYRGDNNIAENWATNMGADYSVQGAPGKVITLNFTDGTGAIN
ncbi:MAG: SusE domain-containing protein [Mediterranea sp.]|jgi:hypothetical protein|nr:SusE domain-containing protein [Mediterranea sp.]